MVNVCEWLTFQCMMNPLLCVYYDGLFGYTLDATEVQLHTEMERKYVSLIEHISPICKHHFLNSSFMLLNFHLKS